MVDLERSTQLTSGPELRDVAANRDQYEPKAGLHFKATDTAAEFIGDGEQWRKIATTGANPSFRSVDTERALLGRAENTSFGDTVDYLNPTWVAESDAFFQSSHVHLSELKTNTSGSGGVAADNINSYVQLKTGTTSGSHARMENEIAPDFSGVKFDWDSRRAVRTGINILDSATDRIDYVCSGGVPASEKGFGFKLTGGDLLGVVNNGSGETTTTLISGVGTGYRRLQATFQPDDRVTFTVDNGAVTGEVATGLPSGADNFGQVFDWWLENTSAVNRRAQISTYAVAQEP